MSAYQHRHPARRIRAAQAFGVGKQFCFPVDIGRPEHVHRTLRSARRRLEMIGNLSVQRLTELPSMDRHPCFPEFLADVGSRLAAQGRCLLLRLLLDGEPLAQALFFRTSEADLLL